MAVDQSPAIAVEKNDGFITLRLDRPKANVLDGAMIRALRAALAEHGRDPHLHAILLTSRGPHFSFGASVEEHRPDQAAEMLGAMNGLVRDLLDLEVPCVAAVRGQCLGGALELVLCASFVVVSPDALLGQPEIRLGVTAPVASALLPFKVGLARAERMLLSGNSLDAEAARAMGLVDEIAEDPEASARAIIADVLLAKSASSLRFALRAARLPLRRLIDEALEAQERLYLDELMKTHDAVEGIAAFLEKRPPRWEDR